jgi:type I restriction enzyme M protein
MNLAIRSIDSSQVKWNNEGSFLNDVHKDLKGFCNSASIERVHELDYVLTPGRYVGLPDEEDDFDFNERFASLKLETNFTVTSLIFFKLPGKTPIAPSIL